MIGVNLLPYAVAGLVAFGSYQAMKMKWKAEGAAIATKEIVQESKKAGEAANAKSETERRRAAVPGSVDRLRKDGASCRDCN